MKSAKPKAIVDMRRFSARKVAIKLVCTKIAGSQLLYKSSLATYAPSFTDR